MVKRGEVIFNGEKGYNFLPHTVPKAIPNIELQHVKTELCDDAYSLIWVYIHRNSKLIQSFQVF